MNFKKTYLLLSAALCLLGGIAASCTQDDSVAGAGTSLPPGEHPLQLTASVGAHIQSRSECKDEWKEDDIIAVRIGNYPVTGSYMLNADGTVKKSVNALSWPQPEDYVTAWYPFVFHDEPQTKPLTDQSDGLVGYDLLGTEPVYKNYKETVDLKFLHRMTKVICKLMPGDGISAEEFATAVLSINGFTAAQFNQGIVTPGGENGWLKPFFDAGNSTPDCPVYEALLVPQDMAGKLLFRINITVNVNGHLIPKTLTYQADAASGKLEAGEYSTYTIVVQKDRLKVNPPITASWNDDREPGSSQPWIFKVVFAENQNIPESRRKDIVFSENVVNGEAYKDGTDDHLEVVGNEFSFSCVIPDEDITLDLRLSNYNADKDTYEYSTETLNNGTKYTFNFRLRSNGMTIVYKEIGRQPQVGDFYYQDGTWSSSLKDGKTCIGIVIYTIDYDRSDEQDMRAKLAELNDFYDYKFSKFKDGVVHGYVLAIKDAADACAWSSSTTQSFGVGLKDASVNDFSGCANTAKVLGLVDTSDDYRNIDVPAFQACRDFEKIVPSSPSSSGWYLPSHGHLNVAKSSNSIVKNNLKTVSEADYNQLTSGNYWTSSEQASRINMAWYMRSFSSMTSTGVKTNKYRVRAVLTF